jgi:hypothetical protein
MTNMSNVPPPTQPDDPATLVGDSPPHRQLAAAESESALLDESTVARSVYLYAVLLLSVGAMVVGGIVMSTSVVHLIAPDTGHRDGLDRAAVGLAEVGRDGIEIAREYLEADQPTLEEFCGSDMDPACVEFYDGEYGSGALDVTDTLDDVVSSIQDETHRQIRMASIGWLVFGLVLLLAGLFSFRFHSRKSALYQS